MAIQKLRVLSVRAKRSSEASPFSPPRPAGRAETHMNEFGYAGCRYRIGDPFCVHCVPGWGADSDDDRISPELDVGDQPFGSRNSYSLHSLRGWSGMGWSMVPPDAPGKQIPAVSGTTNLQ